MLSERKKFLVLSILIASFLSYSFFIYVSPPQTTEPLQAKVSKGKLAWQQYNCIACHQVYGLGEYLGPDLTNTYSSKGPDYIKIFLKNGTVTMPDFHLSDEEIGALVAYLQNIDASGSADPRSFTIKLHGTIQQ